jgi:hypothetical protein
MTYCFLIEENKITIERSVKIMEKKYEKEKPTKSKQVKY